MLKNKHWLVILVGIFAMLNYQNTFADGYSMSVTTGGPQSIDVILGSDGKGTSISEDEITVTTTCRYGYNLTIGTTVNDNNLYLNGNSSNNTSGSYISPLSSQTALSEATNSWGYYFNRSTAPTASSTFSPVPASGSASVITELTTPSSSNISDSFSVYYGVTVTQPAAPTAGAYIVPGTYKMIEDGNHNDGAIVYYFTMANNCIPYTINFSPTSTSTGSSISGTGTMSSQEGYKDVPVTIPQSSFTPPSGYVFIGWNTEQDGSGDWYDGGEEVTDLASPGETITLYAIWWQPLRLYDTVASLVKTYGGSPQTQTVADMRAVITEPTSSNPATDTSNSGVFLYDASTFGAVSDASNDYDIYYYRGIIDSNMTDGNYSFNNIGANGDSAYYPNYVKLDNGTCWRIIRTTGSGGVKMIYNGLYGDSTEGSCGNTSNKSTTKTVTSFASDSSNIKFVGYTYNSSVETTDSFVSVDTVFGSNDNYSTTNTTDSVIKDYIENTWYASNMTSYTNVLEPSAGYCNDRTTYFDDGDHTPYAVSSVRTNSAGYNGSNTAYGIYVRNKITLSCPRGTVDLYTTSSASNGNNQLKYPVAMLTADEIALAGSGHNNNGSSIVSTASNSSYKSFLKSGGNNIDNESWTMSPYYGALEGYLNYGLKNISVSTSKYARPVISLIHDMFVTSGSGTVTDPWTVSSQAPAPSRPTKLYKAIAKMSKGTQTAQDLEATISTSNSGVYEYNSSVFGADSDGVKQDNTKAKIYYYRGIIDDSFATSTYGSSGDGTLYPNYIVLATSSDSLSTSNTCWRIIRTTGSGGVKMIYNGNWTGSTCANSGTSTQTGTAPYTTNSSGNTRRVVRVGYTYNNSYASVTSGTNVSVNTLFGNNSQDNNIKTVVEGWYGNNLSSYSAILESNAGYCNDRSSFSDTTGNNALSTLNSYGRSGSSYINGAYFGAYSRNYNASKLPSLSCSRGTDDIYSTSAASAGNKLLSSPIALITADEASFAGSGASTASSAYGSRYDGSSFLRTNSSFLTMSPSYRQSSSNYPAFAFYLNTSGALTNNGGLTTSSYGVRPVVSLKEGTEAVSGSGTATDPWVVVAP